MAVNAKAVIDELNPRVQHAIVADARGTHREVR
jgi:hypothetical protein